eukprot:3108202-Pyramimonas_sp.AAC.1
MFSLAFSATVAIRSLSSWTDMLNGAVVRFGAIRRDPIPRGRVHLSSAPKLTLPSRIAWSGASSMSSLPSQ